MHATGCVVSATLQAPRRGRVTVALPVFLALLGCALAALHPTHAGAAPRAPHPDEAVTATRGSPDSHARGNHSAKGGVEGVEGFVRIRPAVRQRSRHTAGQRSLKGDISRVRAVLRERFAFARALAFACTGSDSKQATALPPPTA